MASYSYAAIRAGIANALTSLEIQNGGGYILASPTPPSIEVFPGRVAYDAAFQRGHDDLTWTVRVTIPMGLDIAAQQKLDAYLAPSGAESVKTLLEADTTLGGAVIDLHVTEASGFMRDTDTGQRLSCDWTVELVA